MNNEQFRRLVGATSKPQEQSNGSKPSPSRSTSATPSALGSRQRASIPMTPRSVGGGRSEFARQLAARDAANHPHKKFKTSAPKGSRLAEGYVDRAKAREEAEEDERAERIKALEELLKTEQIDQETFDKQMNIIAGGDLSSTHLVKGLDRKLLERIRQGEDVYAEKDEPEPAEPEEDVDDALDRMGDEEIHAVAQEKSEKKKGQLAPAGLVPGKKRTRDQIIAEMKAARAAAKAAQEPSLGDKFRKIGAKPKPGTRIERDHKGREVMIIVDEDGNERRKVRRVQPGANSDAAQKPADFMMPDKNAKPLGMEVPEFYKKQLAEAEEEEDDDIFADAGDDYDPLAGMDSSEDEDEDEDDAGKEDGKKKEKDTTTKGDKPDGKDASRQAMPPPPKPVQPKNYFSGSKTELLSTQIREAPSMSDPAIQAAFQRAAQLRAAREKRDGDRDDEDEDMDEEELRKRAERRKRMLESASRDDEDLDMGFGTSRFEDEEDFDDSKIKLSEWGQDDDEEDGSKGGKGKRKRGPKKRKGDVNSAADVLRVMEQRKGASS